MRWYSKTFHTPLHVVEWDVPLDDILQAWFESEYEGLSEDGRVDEARRLTETPEERAEREAEAHLDDQEDEEFYARFKEAAKGEKLTAPVERPAPKMAIAERQIEEALAQIPDVTMSFPEEGNLPGKDP